MTHSSLRLEGDSLGQRSLGKLHLFLCIRTFFGAQRLSGLQGAIDLMIVSGSATDASETSSNLGLATNRRRDEPIDNGFSGLMKSMDRLQAFLS